MASASSKIADIFRTQPFEGRMADDSSASDIVVSLQADEQHHGTLHSNHLHESRLRTVDW
jgi:hypothetical protein